MDGRRMTDDGRTPDHGHPISSPCEPNGSGELIMEIYMYIAPGLGQTNPWRQIVFINIHFLSICLFSASFPPFDYISPIFPTHMH